MHFHFFVESVLTLLTFYVRSHVARKAVEGVSCAEHRACRSAEEALERIKSYEELDLDRAKAKWQARQKKTNTSGELAHICDRYRRGEIDTIKFIAQVRNVSPKDASQPSSTGPSLVIPPAPSTSASSDVKPSITVPTDASSLPPLSPIDDISDDEGTEAPKFKPSTAPRSADAIVAVARDTFERAVATGTMTLRLDMCDSGRRTSGISPRFLDAVYRRGHRTGGIHPDDEAMSLLRQAIERSVSVNIHLPRFQSTDCSRLPCTCRSPQMFLLPTTALRTSRT